MNSIKALVASLGLAAAISPALATTDGVPPNLATHAASAIQIEGSATRSAPQFLHGQGEVSLVPNPAFDAAPGPAAMRMGTYAPVGYVGA